MPRGSSKALMLACVALRCSSSSASAALDASDGAETNFVAGSMWSGKRVKVSSMPGELELNDSRGF